MMSEEWISVEDRLPDIGDIVDVWTRDGRETNQSFNGISDEDYAFYPTTGGTYLHIDKVTHWQPLPEPPKVEQE